MPPPHPSSLKVKYPDTFEFSFTRNIDSFVLENIPLAWPIFILAPFFRSKFDHYFDKLEISELFTEGNMQIILDDPKR